MADTSPGIPNSMTGCAIIAQPTAQTSLSVAECRSCLLRAAENATGWAMPLYLVLQPSMSRLPRILPWAGSRAVWRNV